MALTGGETAAMPDIYAPGDFDLAGTIVGVVEEAAALHGDRIEPGDVLIGYQSTGLHTNGYTLARRILFDRLKLTVDSILSETGSTVGEALLAVHRSYVKALRPVLGQVHGIAHITGGGLAGNLVRILPPGCDAVVDAGSWTWPPLFTLLMEAGRVGLDEMREVFNLGAGLVVGPAATGWTGSGRPRARPESRLGCWARFAAARKGCASLPNFTAGVPMRRSYFALVALLAAPAAASAQTPYAECDKPLIIVDQQNVNICNAAVDGAQIFHPVAGLLVSGGNPVLASASSLGGLGHFSLTVRANATRVRTPDLDFDGSSTTVPQADKIIAPAPLVEAALGIFKGMNGFLAIDLLGSAQLIPVDKIDNFSVDGSARKIGSVALGLGYGARVGVLPGHAIVPSVVVSVTRRDIPRLTYGSTNGGDTYSFGVDLHATNLRAVAGYGPRSCRSCRPESAGPTQQVDRQEAVHPLEDAQRSFHQRSRRDDLVGLGHGRAAAVEIEIGSADPGGVGPNRQREMSETAETTGAGQDRVASADQQTRDRMKDLGPIDGGITDIDVLLVNDDERLVALGVGSLSRRRGWSREKSDQSEVRTTHRYPCCEIR